MTKIFLRQRKFSYIKTPQMESPQVRGYEEIYSDGHREVTYWKNGKVYRQKIAPHSQISPLSDWAIEDWERNTPLIENLFNNYEDDPDVIKEVEIISDRPIINKINAGLKTSWQKLINRTAKLARKIKLAWQAASRELTRP